MNIIFEHTPKLNNESGKHSGTISISFLGLKNKDLSDSGLVDAMHDLTIEGLAGTVTTTLDNIKDGVVWLLNYEHDSKDECLNLVKYLIKSFHHHGFTGNHEPNGKSLFGNLSIIDLNLKNEVTKARIGQFIETATTLLKNSVNVQLEPKKTSLFTASFTFFGGNRQIATLQTKTSENSKTNSIATKPAQI